MIVSTKTDDRPNPFSHWEKVATCAEAQNNGAPDEGYRGCRCCTPVRMPLAPVPLIRPSGTFSLWEKGIPRSSLGRVQLISLSAFPANSQVTECSHDSN